MNYTEEIEKAKDFLNRNDYVFCIIQCGKILESAIKYLFFRYLETTNKDKRIFALKIQKELAKPPRERSYEDFTLGKMVTLLERSDAILQIMPTDNSKHDRKRQTNLWDLVDIRNRATHLAHTDKDAINEEHAYIMYGNVLRITAVRLKFNQ